MNYQNLKVYDITQKSDKWDKLRLGKITGSGFYKLIKGNGAKENYIFSKASERIISEKSDQDKYTNFHMQRGNCYEDEAKDYYLLKTYNKIIDVGLIEHDMFVACSPDGLILTDEKTANTVILDSGEIIKYNGLAEVKVPDTYNFLKQIYYIKEQGIKGIPEEYFYQMQFNMWNSNGQWCDYVLYNPEYEKVLKNTTKLGDNTTFIIRVEPDPKIFKKIETTVLSAIEEIGKIIKVFHS
jgi:hypothetical protein